MKTLIKLIITACIGVGVFYAVHITSAEKAIRTFLTEKGLNPAGLSEIYLIIPLAAGLLTVLGIFLLFWIISLRSHGESPAQGPDGEDDHHPDIYHTLMGHIQQYEEFLSERSPEETNEALYTFRKQDKDFLEALVATLGEEKEAPEPVIYESGIRPDLLIREVRKLLQATIYIDFQNYYGSIHTGPIDTDVLAWDNFAPTMHAIGKLSASLKECLKFYLNMCSIEKDKFSNLRGYNILPSDSPNPDDGFFYLLGEEKKLGADFDYQSLFEFRKVAGNVKISINPSIPDTYRFIDSYISGLYETVSSLLLKGKHLFKYFQITREKYYQRMVWIIENLDQVNAESATYYKNSLSRQKDTYKKALKENGFDPNSPPTELLSFEAINDLRKQLEKIIMGDKGSNVIYETTTHTNPKKKEQQ